ncbi:MAG: ATP-dependent Clp protease ATP-binding subunit [Parcubacteria group bacterium]
MNTKIFQSIKTFKYIPLRVIVFWRIVLLILGSAGSIGYLARYFNYITLDSNLIDLSTFILLPIGITILFFEIFLKFHIIDPPIKDDASIEERFDFNTRKILYHAYNIHPKGGITIPDLTLALLKDPSARILWARMGINPADVGEFFAQNINQHETSTEQQKDYTDLIVALDVIREDSKSKRIYMADLFVVLFDLDPLLQQFLLQADISREDLSSIATWYDAKKQYIQRSRRFWMRERQLEKRPVGLGWAYGYTPALSRFAHDISAQFEGTDKKLWLVGREDELVQIERILSRSRENNVLLVGPPGVGKQTTVHGLAQRIIHNHSLPGLAYKRVFELDVASIMSSSSSPQEIEALLLTVLHDATKAGNIILFINDFQNVIGLTDSMGSTDMSEILKPYLESSAIQILATIDDEHYHTIVERRPDILKVFEKIDIAEPNETDTIRILQTMLPYMEAHEKILITHQALRAVVLKSGAFIQDRPFPEKAIDLLTEVVADVKTGDRQLVQKDDVDKVISQKTHIPLGSLTEGEKEKLQHLKELLHEDVVNQEQAVIEVSRTITRLRAGITSIKKPAGSFLFTGPTGVGKTLTARTLAKVYFGSEENMIRFDMSEYQNSDAMDRFLGSPKTGEASRFLNATRDNPYAVLLFDEFEKAHPSIHNLFLQILDEGSMTDAYGKKVSLKQHIIIATSNAGAEHIREMIKQDIDPASEQAQLIDYLLQNSLFRPELLNRFDDVIIFHPLTDKHLHEVASRLLEKLAKRLKEQNYYLTITADLISYVARKGYNPQFGARPMQRLIQDTAEVWVAEAILNKRIKKGEQFEIDMNAMEKGQLHDTL